MKGPNFTLDKNKFLKMTSVFPAVTPDTAAMAVTVMESWGMTAKQTM
jgi:hypothetical protein